MIDGHISGPGAEHQIIIRQSESLYGIVSICNSVLGSVGEHRGLRAFVQASRYVIGCRSSATKFARTNLRGYAGVACTS